MFTIIVGGLGFWLVGYGLAFGEGDNGFIGTTYFGSIGVPTTQYPHLFFQVRLHIFEPANKYSLYYPR